MKQDDIARALAAMVRETPAVRGCALVEAESGLILLRIGDKPEFDPLWEASADYWRMHGRLRGHFDLLGDLGAAVMYHRLGILAIMPCRAQPELLVVCVGENGKIDWGRWQQRIRELGNMIRAAA
ncbi:MAG: hypothetical protein JWN73_315 [Betaproteobacteria bacterium]|nr:hypothetical protein [Betaproteobacteria bacterium]